MPDLIDKMYKLSGLTPGLTRAIWAGVRADPPVYVDIGARGGLPRPWLIAHRLGLIRPVLVEPEPIAAEALRNESSAIVIPHALGSDDGKTETLHVTVVPGKGSLLRPDRSNPHIDSTWDVTKTMEIRVRRFDRIWDEGWGLPIYVKLDVQGYELEVIEGMGRYLDYTLCVELECSLEAFYENQPLFQDIYRYMTSRGYDLVKLRPLGLFHGVAIVEMNAYFVRRSHHGDKRVRLWKAVNNVGDQRRTTLYGY